MASAGLLVAVRLTPPQQRILQAMGQRAGEISWSWANCRPDVAEMARDLIEKRLVTDQLDRGCLRLTDQGREAVFQMEQSAQRARIIRA